MPIVYTEVVNYETGGAVGYQALLEVKVVFLLQ